MSSKEEIQQAVEDRVKWWLNDMAFKPPELLIGARGEHYFDCMAKDIGQVAVDELDFEFSSKRLDP